MSKKQALTLQNLQDGDFIEQVNEAILEANTAIGASDNPKAKATLTIQIVIEPGDTDGYFRKVTPSLVVKAPALPKKPSLYPVQRIGGEMVIAVDPAQDGTQMKVPGTGGAPLPDGVADIGAQRAAS
jgi:hypothetical protein